MEGMVIWLRLLSIFFIDFETFFSLPLTFNILFFLSFVFYSLGGVPFLIIDIESSLFSIKSSLIIICNANLRFLNNGIFKEC